MVDVYSTTDDAVLQELGERLSLLRLNRGLTQAELAKEAGLSKRTVERIEAGGSTQTSSLLRALRALGLLQNIDALIPPPAPNPMDLLKLHSKQRQRASSRKKPPTVAADWVWGDSK